MLIALRGTMPSNEHSPNAAAHAAALPPFTIVRGDAPLLVSMPHVGTRVPEEIAARLTPEARALADTDWHLPLLYDFLGELGATVLTATRSRLVVDLNRPPDNRNLYPGQDTTGLVPVDTFRGEPVYAGNPPDADEVARRRELWWRPYHDTLAHELARLRETNPRVVLWDAHSIASRVPRFFTGALTDLNFGTASGASCARGLIAAVLAPAAEQARYSVVLNGRFKGGHITRHYGAPERGIHAIQLELSQRTYMEEDAPFAFRRDLADEVAPLIRACLESALAWSRDTSA